jgi:hypothetical protein
MVVYAMPTPVPVALEPLRCCEAAAAAPAVAEVLLLMMLFRLLLLVLLVSVGDAGSSSTSEDSARSPYIQLAQYSTAYIVYSVSVVLYRLSKVARADLRSHGSTTVMSFRGATTASNYQITTTAVKPRSQRTRRFTVSRVRCYVEYK